MVIAKLKEGVVVNINFSAVVTICIFLVVQGGAFLWSFSTLTAQVSNLSKDVQEYQSEYDERLTKETTQRIEDRRRIYDRIVDIEKVISAMTAQEQATRVLLEGLKEDVTNLRVELAANNKLIREILSGNIKDASGGGQ